MVRNEFVELPPVSSGINRYVGGANNFLFIRGETKGIHNIQCMYFYQFVTRNSRKEHSDAVIALRYLQDLQVQVSI